MLDSCSRPLGHSLLRQTVAARRRRKVSSHSIVAWHRRTSCRRCRPPSHIAHRCRTSLHMSLVAVDRRFTCRRSSLSTVAISHCIICQGYGVASHCIFSHRGVISWRLITSPFICISMLRRVIASHCVVVLSPLIGVSRLRRVVAPHPWVGVVSRPVVSPCVVSHLGTAASRGWLYSGSGISRGPSPRATKVGGAPTYA